MIHVGFHINNYSELIYINIASPLRPSTIVFYMLFHTFSSSTTYWLEHQSGYLFASFFPTIKRCPPPYPTIGTVCRNRSWFVTNIFKSTIIITFTIVLVLVLKFQWLIFDLFVLKASPQNSLLHVNRLGFHKCSSLSRKRI